MVSNDIFSQDNILILTALYHSQCLQNCRRNRSKGMNNVFREHRVALHYIWTRFGEPSYLIIDGPRVLEIVRVISSIIQRKNQMTMIVLKNWFDIGKSQLQLQSNKNSLFQFHHQFKVELNDRGLLCVNKIKVIQSITNSCSKSLWS